MRIGQFIEYKGYFGSIEYDHEDGLYYGKLLYIRDLVNYHADNIIDLEKCYRDAVDDYICFKKEIEKERRKPWTKTVITQKLDWLCLRD